MPIASTVEAITNRKLISVDEGDSIYHAISVMVDRNVGSVIVTSGGQPTGIITERDLMRKVVLQEIETKKALAREIMSTPLITIDAGASFGEAATLMFSRKVRRLLVEKDDKIIGIFTQRDLEGAALDYFLAVSSIV